LAAAAPAFEDRLVLCCLVLLVVVAVAEAGADAVGCGGEVRAECVDELLEGDHRAVGGEVDGGDGVAGLVAYGCGDGVEVGGEL
jgi:hypothetical protein